MPGTETNAAAANDDLFCDPGASISCDYKVRDHCVVVGYIGAPQYLIRSGAVEPAMVGPPIDSRRRRGGLIDLHGDHFKRTPLSHGRFRVWRFVTDLERAKAMPGMSTSDLSHDVVTWIAAHPGRIHHTTIDYDPVRFSGTKEQLIHYELARENDFEGEFCWQSGQSKNNWRVGRLWQNLYRVATFKLGGRDDSREILKRVCISSLRLAWSNPAGGAPGTRQ